MQYLFTERAHLMCPRMCFGIVTEVGRSYEEPLIRECVDQLSAAHPFLNALLGWNRAENAYFYDVTDQTRVEFAFYDRDIGNADSPEIMDEYRRQTERDWNLFEEGMLKITAWRMGGNTCFLLVFHHLLADGRGALELAHELADCYVQGTKPGLAREQLITAKDLPADSRMPFISRALVSRANKNWAAEGQMVSYPEYHAFADDFLKKDAVSFSVSRMDQDEVNAILCRCRASHVTVNDYLIAKMMIEEHAEKVVMACDLRDRLDCYQAGAMGNYSTAFSVSVKAKTADPFIVAKAVHGQVQKRMACPSALYLVLQCYASLDPGLLDAALISCRGSFKSRTGRFIGSRFFGFETADGCSVTNLGRIESSSILSGFFIPPASPAMRKTWGVLTVNNVLTICTGER